MRSLLALTLLLAFVLAAYAAPQNHDLRVRVFGEQPVDAPQVIDEDQKSQKPTPIFDNGLGQKDDFPLATPDLFVQFMREHGKTYEVSEVKLRFDIFSQNLNFIRMHNKKAQSGLATYKVGINKFADMTPEEFSSKLLKTKSVKRDAKLTADLSSQVKALPTSVDWRPKGVVTGVKDQGSCGSCWAFSSTGSMEGAHALATGTLISLSEQLLVDCANGGTDTCDAGGEMSDGYEYVISAGGAISEADYPYLGTSGNTCAFEKSEVVATFSSWQAVESGNETALAVAAVARPTVSVAIDASSLGFQLYESGVYSDPDCHKDNADLDHAVLVVGYDTDATSGSNYWIVKNSWGESWGLDGYIWMLKDGTGTLANNCGIATDAMFIVV